MLGTFSFISVMLDFTLQEMEKLVLLLLLITVQMNSV